MSTIKTAELKKLEQLVKEREEFLTKVISVTLDLFKEIGRTIRNKVFDFHINTIVELKNFHKFSFNGNFGHSQFGGNDIQILFQDEIVMDIYYPGSDFNVKECEVVSFKEDTIWQIALEDIVKNREKYVYKVLLKRLKATKELQTGQILEKEKKRLCL